MWSGPRNISTALMRSWGNRADTVVCDEPLYAHYLAVTNAPHPGAAEVVRRHETDWREVVRFLTGPIPLGKAIFYQKHMSHHLLPDVDRTWLWELEHAFLIRDPRETLLSLSKVVPQPSLLDSGLPQQVELFEEVRRRTGRAPPVLDAKDVLSDPERVLTRLCEVLGVEFSKEMLSWPSGSRATDGVWARHWYGDALRSTGFESWRPREGGLTPELRHVHEQCLPLYERLARYRLDS